VKIHLRRLFCCACVLLSALFVLCVVPWSDSFADSKKNIDALKKEFDATFEKMLDDPADIDVTLLYAELAVELEDYEAAITALERVLLFNPDLPKIKLFLGIMYYNLKSFDVAKDYIKDSIRGKKVPKDVIAQAKKYLKKIEG